MGKELWNKEIEEKIDGWGDKRKDRRGAVHRDDEEKQNNGTVSSKNLFGFYGDIFG